MTDILHPLEARRGAEQRYGEQESAGGRLHDGKWCGVYDVASGEEIPPLLAIVQFKQQSNRSLLEQKVTFYFAVEGGFCSHRPHLLHYYHDDANKQNNPAKPR